MTQVHTWQIKMDYCKALLANMHVESPHDIETEPALKVDGWMTHNKIRRFSMDLQKVVILLDAFYKFKLIFTRCTLTICADCGKRFEIWKSISTIYVQHKVF